MDLEVNPTSIFDDDLPLIDILRYWAIKYPH